MERAAAVAAFFAALRQFPFYLYPNRGHSGPLTVFIDLFAFAVIYVCDCFSFCFFLFSLFWFVLLLLYHFFSCSTYTIFVGSFALSAHCCCGCNRYFSHFLYRICDCSANALLAYVIHVCRNVDTALFDLLSYFNAINEKQ